MPSTHPSTRLSFIYPSIHPSLCTLSHLLIYFSHQPTTHVSTQIPTQKLSAHLYIIPPTHPSTHPSIHSAYYSFISLTSHPSIHLSIAHTHLLMCLHRYPLRHLPTYSYTIPPTHPSSHPSIHTPDVHPSLYPPTQLIHPSLLLTHPRVCLDTH